MYNDNFAEQNSASAMVFGAVVSHRYLIPLHFNDVEV